MFNSYFIFSIENNSKLHFKDLAASIIRGMIREQVPLISARLQAGLITYAILLACDSKFTPVFEYVIIFGLMRFGINDPRWRLAEATLLSHYQSHV